MTESWQQPYVFYSSLIWEQQPLKHNKSCGKTLSKSNNIAGRCNFSSPIAATASWDEEHRQIQTCYPSVITHLGLSQVHNIPPLQLPIPSSPPSLQRKSSFLNISLSKKEAESHHGRTPPECLGINGLQSSQ